MSENLHQSEFVKLISEDHLEFDSMFDVDDSEPRPILSEVLFEIAQQEDDEVVWTPNFNVTISEELLYPTSIPHKTHEAKVLQVVGGRIFIEKMSVIEVAGEYFIAEGALN
jgi:hypothetical protein